MKEQSILHHILLACSHGVTRLFRNNTGVAWAGREVVNIRGKSRMVMCHDGDAVVRSAQPIKYGLCIGSSDTIGWTQRVIQPHDVGRTVALFAAVEAKTATGRVRPEQANFIDRVNAAGGVAGVARSSDEALTLLSTGGNVGHANPETGG